MFRENDQHLQQGMFDTFQQLPERVQKRLEGSWADSFYREVFCRIDESPFAILYSEQPSRPNTPINILVGVEILKAGHGWSDEELYDEIQFNLQVRHALGLRDINLVPFELRTLYNFRQRLSRHMQETGENLLEQVFVQVTDEQLGSLKLRTGHQRMDSVLISSNIRQMTRLQLLIEVVQRVWRILTEEDQAEYATAFDAYRQGTAGQYCYRVKGEDLSGHLAAVGQLMYCLVGALEAQYAEQPVYQMLERVFAEHFSVEGGTEGSDAAQVRVKVGDELSACSLQSPDDWEATFREKRGQGYRGYVANLAETCDPANPVQLITHIQAGPNLTDDEQMGVHALPDLKARTDLKTLWTDGGYTGPAAEAAFREHQVEHIPTSIRGCHVSSKRLGLSAFSWELDEEGKPRTVRCPGEQQVAVRVGFNPGRFLVDFDAAVCQICSWADQCPAEPRTLRPTRVLYVGLRQAQVAQLRQRSLQTRTPGNNWRSAIESTVRSLTHPFGGQAGKLPVRGQPRVTQMIFCSALMVNLRRIWRHERELAEKASQTLRLLLSFGLRDLRSWFHCRSVRRFPNSDLILLRS
jgi:hypothetical protein